jgi:hypothetical protein
MDCCNCHGSDPHRANPAYRRVLWVALAINAAMFLVEIGAGLAAGPRDLATIDRPPIGFSLMLSMDDVRFGS